MQSSALITVAVTPLLDAGLECLLTPGDYELLCRKQDEDRVRKLEVSDKEHSENSDCEIICPDKVRVSTNKVDSVPEKISATINEGDSGNSNSDAMCSDDARVSTGEINSKEEIVVATRQENMQEMTMQENKPEMTLQESKPEIKENEPRNKQDETVEQTISKRDSHDSIPTIGLEKFVDVDRSTDGAVCITIDNTVVQQTFTKKNPDSDDGVNSRLSETGIEPRSDILIEQLNSTAIEADTDNPEQLESLVVELPTTTVEKWKNKKKNVAPKYRKRKKVKKKYLISSDEHLRHMDYVPQTILRSGFKVRVRQNGN